MEITQRRPIYSIFIIILVLELAVGYYLTSIYGFMSGDASSRVANAFYVLYSREPNLANIGFVWNPLPSLMEIIPLLFYPLFPKLASDGLAAVIVSSIFAALTAALIVKAGLQFGLNKWLSITIALLYALNPYIFYYGANGLTEVIFIYFINMAVIQILLWMQYDHAKPLIISAFALAFAFWTRYETVFFGSAVAFVVLIWIIKNSKDTLKDKWHQVEGTWTVLLSPVVFSGLLWIFFNYTIMGDGLYFLTSDYGNLGQAKLLMEDEKFTILVGNIMPTLAFVMERLWYFCIPLLIIIVIRIIERRIIRWDFLVLFLLAISIPSMQIILLLKGGTAAWIRYYMYAFPIITIWLPYEISQMRFKKTGSTLLILGMSASIVIMGLMMNNPRIASDEYEAFRYNKLFTEQEMGKQATAYINNYLSDKIILTDSFSSFRIIMSSNHPKNFVVTSNRDFTKWLEKPTEHPVDYILLPNPQAVLTLDRVNQTYPTLYNWGADWASLDKEFKGYWKLYKVNKPAPLNL
ncbi:glycosyltransferase family 39 protein [Paenibacillus sp. N1-5-1-14]|uniref:glycosyltransferase family 39 protein n=1 Tax=Paenibacillus radicibacter TaxID=2972488 RepID=UPI00215915A9|nr:glycosyltransferase family 39 protein [Paenibacillus radicibacter]MCR8643476.1 glycosyltransferase family 39 protein [Paenibacillus radicibacter]